MQRAHFSMTCSSPQDNIQQWALSLLLTLRSSMLLLLYRDVNNLMLQKNERGMKKVLNSRLGSEMVDPEVCQGFTTYKVKAAIRNINPIKAAGPDKIHPRFQHHSDLVSISLLTSILNKSWAETQVPQEWRKADIIPIPKEGKDLQKMESYGTISLTSTEGKTMERLVTNHLQYFA